MYIIMITVALRSELTTLIGSIRNGLLTTQLLLFHLKCINLCLAWVALA